MSIRSSPLLGYNNNVRHKGKVFHIQTEDSGVRYGHITTHLFMDGGRILKSIKTSYAEFLGNERMGDIVREMMKQQHKAMFIALRDGKFDTVSEAPAARQALRPGPGPGPTGETPSPGPAQAKLDDPAQPRSYSASPEAPTEPGRAPTPALDATQSRPPEVVIDVVPPVDPGGDANLAVAIPPSDLPPAPASLLRDKTSSAPPPSPAASRSPAPPDVTGAERRYAPTRPASIFGQARPQQGKSIFGEDVMGDKSLDDVILNYLAEDTEGDKK